MKAVSSCSRINRSVNSITVKEVFGSSAAVCSSSKIRSGRCNVAINNVMAWRCPPESNPISASKRFSKCKFSIASCSWKKLRSLLFTPKEKPRLCPRFIASAKFSSTDKRTAVPILGSWKTRLILFERRVTDCLVISSSFKNSWPSSTGRVPATLFSSVDFPAPFPPMIVTNSPGAKLKLMPRSTWFSLTVPRSKY